jgi:hypothetical protein
MELTHRIRVRLVVAHEAVVLSRGRKPFENEGPNLRAGRR